MDTVETAIIAELEAWEKKVRERRDELLATTALDHTSMGQAFAIGALDASIWHMIRRARGEER